MQYTFKIRPISHDGSLAQWLNSTTQTQNDADSDIKLSDSELVVIREVSLSSRASIRFIHDAMYRDAMINKTATILQFQLVTNGAAVIARKILHLISQ